MAKVRPRGQAPLARVLLSFPSRGGGVVGAGGGTRGRPDSRKGCWLTFQRLMQPNGRPVSRMARVPADRRAARAGACPWARRRRTGQSGNAKGARRRLREGWGVSALLVNSLRYAGVPRNGLPRDRDPGLEERVSWPSGRATRPSPTRKPLKTARLASGRAGGSRPLPRAGLHKAVPQTATGLQGEQPLVKQDNVGKGSRQISSVTSGEGVALRAE